MAHTDNKQTSREIPNDSVNEFLREIQRAPWKDRKTDVAVLQETDGSHSVIRESGSRQRRCFELVMIRE